MELTDNTTYDLSQACNANNRLQVTFLPINLQVPCHFEGGNSTVNSFTQCDLLNEHIHLTCSALPSSRSSIQLDVKLINQVSPTSQRVIHANGPIHLDIIFLNHNTSHPNQLVIASYGEAKPIHLDQVKLFHLGYALYQVYLSYHLKNPLFFVF